MQINLTGHHIDITESLRKYVQTKFKRLERHFEPINHIHVILSVDKVRQKAEAKLMVKGNEIFATSEAEVMYAAIDTLMDKLDRQLIKHKEKIIRY
jgi:putative sigma-54 modulation protein